MKYPSIPLVHAKKSSKKKQKHSQQREKEHVKKATSWKKAPRQIVFPNWSTTCFTPQGCYARMQALSVSCIRRLQIKNIKLHIVTDIKVNFNSMLGFRISLFGWGDGYFYYLKKWRHYVWAISVCNAGPYSFVTAPSLLACLLACLLVCLVCLSKT